MSEEEEFTDEEIKEIQILFGGKTEQQKDLEEAEKGLDAFITKYGGQYFGVLIWPSDEKREKYKVGPNNRVHIFPSARMAPFDEALISVFNWMRMEQAKRE